MFPQACFAPIMEIKSEPELVDVQRARNSEGERVDDLLLMSDLAKDTPSQLLESVDRPFQTSL